MTRVLDGRRRKLGMKTSAEAEMREQLHREELAIRKIEAEKLRRRQEAERQELRRLTRRG